MLSCLFYLSSKNQTRSIQLENFVAFYFTLFHKEKEETKNRVNNQSIFYMQSFFNFERRYNVLYIVDSQKKTRINEN